MLVLAVVGFIDASYLTALHYLEVIPPCSIVAGCEQVLTSKYSVIFGVPAALFGSVFYLSIFILALLYKELKSDKILSVSIYLSGAAFLFSLLMVYLQLFVLRSICLYCMASAVFSSTIFLLMLIVNRKKTLINESA